MCKVFRQPCRGSRARAEVALPARHRGTGPPSGSVAHMLVLDGACAITHDRARSHHAPAPSDAELIRLLNTLIRRITRTPVRAGVLVEDPEQPWLDL